MSLVSVLQRYSIEPSLNLKTSLTEYLSQAIKRFCQCALGQYIKNVITNANTKHSSLQSKN